MSEAENIQVGAAEQGCALIQEDTERLVEFLSLLEKWNKVYRLTAIPRSEWVPLHVLDCLAVVQFLDGGAIADVGSGAGFPGIPLAIARPDWSVTLIESNQKKASFLRQVLVDLRISNASVFGGRVESLVPGRGFDVVISRAFSELGKFVRLAGHLCRYSGTLAAMKADVSKEELNSVDGEFRCERIVSLKIPLSAVKRSLVLIRKSPNQ